MKSEEKQNSINDKDNNDNNSNNNTIPQNYFLKDKPINSKTKNIPKFASIFNNTVYQKFSNKADGQKQTDFKFKVISTVKKQLPLLTLNSLSFYEPLTSENSKILDVESLKKKLLLNKEKINKKKNELQELKIQYNKLLEESKNHKNLIFDILNLENEANNNENLNSNNSGRVLVTEEQLKTKINACKINEIQEKKLRDSFDLINLRMEINNQRKMLIDKSNECDKLKENTKYKKINEMTIKLEELIISEENMNKEIGKLEEILQKNNEILPNLEKEFETEEKNYKELKKSEKELEEKYNDKMVYLNKIKNEIQRIGNKQKTNKITINNITLSPEYNGAKTLGIKLKSRIDKYKFDIEQIDNYKNEKREEIINLISERKSKNEEQKKKNDELESKINELSEKNRDLYLKSMEYDEEKKKLENRGKETHKDIKAMKDLENQLNNLKKKKQELINEYEEREKFLKNSEEEQNENNKNILEKLNKMKNNIKNMNDEVDELSNKINEIQKDIDKYQEQIDIKKKEIEDLNNEMKEKEPDNEENQNLAELQNKKKNLIQENDNYKKENEKLKNEIKLIEEQIQKYVGANGKLVDIK